MGVRSCSLEAGRPSRTIGERDAELRGLRQGPPPPCPGGFDKTPTAFAEFVGADPFRRSVPVKLVRSDFAYAPRALLPESVYLIRAADRPPDRHERCHQHDHQCGDYVAQGNRTEHQRCTQYHDDCTDQPLGCLEWRMPPRMDELFEISQNWYSSLQHGSMMSRRQRRTT